MSRRGHFGAVSRQTGYLPLEAWPKADQVLWARITTRSDIFDGGGRATLWKPRTVRNVLEGYGAWLKWLSEEVDDALSLSPSERVTQDRVRQYKEMLETKNLAPSTVQLRLQRLGQAMVAFTGTSDFRWLFKAANRLKPVSVRNKRARVVPSYRLADLGFQLMRNAETMPASWHFPPAAEFRNGLLIAFLAYRPVRIGNLAAMTLGGHIARQAEGYSVSFTAAETKQNDIVEFLVPAPLTECLDHYLNVYRPQLVDNHAATDCLWVSRDGGPFTAQGISAMIVDKTRKAFGHHINPHMFRDCAATTIAIDDPEHAFAIAAILGHSSMATSERHYNQAKMLEAGTAYHQVLESVRRRRYVCSQTK